VDDSEQTEQDNGYADRREQHLGEKKQTRIHGDTPQGWRGVNARL
jgi:hypothetical protein